MALTANPQSALPPEPVWNQVIVPTLRKRLQDESHALAKRMSAASITSDEDTRPSLSSQPDHVKGRATPSNTYTKPSSIPRPSLQYSRTDGSGSSIGRSSNSGSFKRMRTNSQPFPLEQPPTPSTPSPPLPQQQPVRAESPFTPTAKGTRIPVSRTRTGSTSSHQQPNNGRSDSRAGLPKTNGGYVHEADLYPVEETLTSSVNSRSTAFRTPRSQFSELVNEQAPFVANSISSRKHRYPNPDYSPPRLSNESEERPFEHWYRGDVSRNGGVGELRVARRQEMLEIANYGHTLRLASAKLGSGTRSRSRSNSRGREAFADSPRTRQRAESLGARQSIYLDDYEQAKIASMVFDEQPLTDLESDEEGDADEYDLDAEGDAGVDGDGDGDGTAEGGGEVGDDVDTDETTTEGQDYLLSPHGNGAVSPPPSMYDRSTTPTSTRDFGKPTFQSRIPTPTPRFTDPPRTPTPTQALPAPPTPRSRSNTQPQLQASHPLQSQPQSRSTSPLSQLTNAAKRRGKSPSSSTTASPKKPRKSKSPAKQARKDKDKDEQRASLSLYPAPDGDDISHAVPSWTQPVGMDGNWDDVVLPTVAKKKGLGGYETTVGSPKPKPAAPIVYEPAPGTFGLQQTKHQTPRGSMEAADIPLYEFGHRKDPPPTSPSPSPPPSPAPSTPTPSSPIKEQPKPVPQLIPQRRESPPPFSHYVVEDGLKDQPMPEIMVTRPSMEDRVHVERFEEHGSGCCKCVIM